MMEIRYLRTTRTFKTRFGSSPSKHVSRVDSPVMQLHSERISTHTSQKMYACAISILYTFVLITIKHKTFGETKATKFQKKKKITIEPQPE